MNRCEWEADAAARRRGFADRHELFAAIAAERLAAIREAEHLREVTAAREVSNGKVADWIGRFDRARQSNCAHNITI